MKPELRDNIEKYLVNLIQDTGETRVLSRPERLLLWVLTQLSRLYGGIIQLRHFLYAHGLMRHYQLGCQVISVGNLTVGGTGKTPVVEIFARELQKEGRKVAILSRGYKSVRPKRYRVGLLRLLRGTKRKPRVVSDGKKLLLDSAASGDEAYMLASNLRETCVLVDRDRVKSGRYAINRLKCDTLILDDGFQYLRLKPRVQVVLVDRTNPFGNEYVLPRGILREPVQNIRRADFIFITKSDGKGTDALKARLRLHNPTAEIIECRHAPRYVENLFTRERKGLDFLKGLEVVSVSGIAAPIGFEAELERQGAILRDRFRFADHHRYGQQEIIDILNRATSIGAAAVLTTEKDAVRFPMLERFDIPVYFLRVDIEISSGHEDFRACISRICFR